MKKTNAQFALVFVGVLLLHLAVATALMKSAETDEGRRSVTVVHPTYHSDDGKPEPARGPGAGNSPAATPSDSREPMPDAFADLTEPSPPPSPADPVPPPPIPVKTPPPSPEKEPVPEPSTRQLTVSQLLAADSELPKVKPLSDTDADAPAPEIERGPKKSNAGPRKVRSLSGGN